jgi:hypothetical protein
MVALGIINLHYFLVGAFAFIFMKFITNFDYFAKDNLFTNQMAKVWHFIFGLICILVGINGIFAIVQIHSMTGVIDYRHVLPTFLFFICVPIFLSDSLKNPSKNYLLALAIGVIISTVGILTSLIIGLIGPENLFGTHILFVNYILLIPILGGTGLGIIIGLLLYYLWFKRKWVTRNELLWDKSNLWALLNNQYLLLALSIIMFFECWFQWHSTSLISLLVQIF